MIPLPQILAELIMALGAALAGANIWALLKPVVRPDAPTGRTTARGRVIVNTFIGLLVFAWGFASFVTKNGV